jgi:integrase
MGTIFKRGRIFYIGYYVYRDSKKIQVHESTHGTSERKARQLLNEREFKKIDPVIKKVLFDDLASDFITDYRINSRRSFAKAQRSVSYLKEFFSGMRAEEISSDKINLYRKKRLEQGYSKASINREMAALKRMFHLGARCTPPKVTSIPHIPMFDERPYIRKGFFSHEQFLKVMANLPKHLRIIALFGYQTGWRSSEIKRLRWPNVDHINGTVRVEGDVTKNKEAKTIKLSSELKDAFQDLYLNRKSDMWVFTYDGKKPISDFRRSWNLTCEKAGCPGMLFHDLRRCFAINGRRSGNSETVIMKMGGWKTRSVFDRYAIVSDQDLEEATQKMEAYYQKLEGQLVNVISIPFRFQNDKKNPPPEISSERGKLINV